MPENSVHNTDEGIATATTNWDAPSSSDNSGISTLTSTHYPGDTFSIGNTSVTYTAADPSGNVLTESFIVTIQGKM